MFLTVVIPVGPNDNAKVERLLASIDRQAFPKEELEILLMREGNSEEARARGIEKAEGRIIGCIDSDNILLGYTFLWDMATEADREGITGAYPSHYAWMSEDPPLNRYFALIGANDPLCWWLGKADRFSFMDKVPSGNSIRQCHGSIPTLGTNGFFVKAAIAKRFIQAWRLSHIEGCEAMRQAGYYTYIITPNVIWHQTGDSLLSWSKKRLRYANELYWKQATNRQWRMVKGPGEWTRVALFALSSICILPQLWVAIKGYRRIKDAAWFLHPIVCLLCTLTYAWSLILHGIDQLQVYMSNMFRRNRLS